MLETTSLKKLRPDPIFLFNNIISFGLLGFLEFFAISSLYRIVTVLFCSFGLTAYHNFWVQVGGSVCKIKIEFPVYEYFKNTAFALDMGSYYYSHR